MEVKRYFLVKTNMRMAIRSEKGSLRFPNSLGKILPRSRQRMSCGVSTGITFYFYILRVVVACQVERTAHRQKRTTPLVAILGAGTTAGSAEIIKSPRPSRIDYAEKAGQDTACKLNGLYASSCGRSVPAMGSTGPFSRLFGPGGRCVVLRTILDPRTPWFITETIMFCNNILLKKSTTIPSANKAIVQQTVTDLHY